MEQVLSQNEVNALLEAVSDGKLATGPGSDDAKDQSYERYDLASQDRIIRGRMPGLEMINDRFNRYLQIALSTLLRRVCEVQPEFSGLMKFGEYVNQLIEPTCLNLFKLSPLRGVAIVAIETRFIFSMLNSFFGGRVESDKPVASLETHDFTLIEANIVQKIVRTILAEVERAWHPVHEIKTAFLRTEINPQFIGVVPMSDVVINTQYTVQFENAVGVLSLVIPYSTIEPIRQKLSISNQSEEFELDLHWIQRLKEEMLKAEVNLRVDLGHGKLSVKELYDLKPGDVLMLNTDASSPLTLKIENIPKMRGVPIIHKGHMALKVTSQTVDDDKPATL